jgi:hypothetical protein
MVEQLWIVFLDGIAQNDVLPFASSEEKALSMWRERTTLGPIARARLRAVPKADDRAAIALFIVQNLANKLRDESADVNGGDLINCVARALDDAGFIAEARAASSGRFHPIPKKAPALAVVQNIALLFRDQDEDINGADFVDFVSRELDNAGFLAEARADAGNLSSETKGYHCWVVTSKKPRHVRNWVATRRSEAVSQVKNAVREHKSEGGVESHDAKKPFEVTFSVLRGKLITTKHTD